MNYHSGLPNYNLLPYHDSLIFIEGNREVVQGIMAIAATGHSPGTMFTPFRAWAGR
jgi:hypothetical protein